MSLPLGGVCRRCGYRAGLLEFLAEATAHEAIRRALELPAPLARRLLVYVELFTPPKRDLTVDRIAAVLAGVLEIVERGTVMHRGAEIAAPALAIAAALDAIEANRQAGSLELPLRNHAYLASVIAGQAGKAARDAERAEAGTRPLHASHMPAASTARPDSSAPLRGEHIPARTPSTEQVLAEHARLRQRGTVVDAEATPDLHDVQAGGRAALRRMVHGPAPATAEEQEQRRRAAAALIEQQKP